MQDLIDTLASTLALPEAPQPEGSAFALSLDGVTVTFQCAAPSSDQMSPVVLSARLGRADAEPPVDLLEMLLAGNLSDDAQPHHSLCADRRGDIYLMRHLGADDLRGDGLLDALERFVPHAARWQARLAGVLAE